MRQFPAFLPLLLLTAWLAATEYLLQQTPGALLPLHLIPALLLPALYPLRLGRRLPLQAAAFAAQTLALLLAGANWQNGLCESVTTHLQLTLALPILRRFAGGISHEPQRLPLFVLLVCCLPALLSALLQNLYAPVQHAPWYVWFCGSSIATLALLPLSLHVQQSGWKGLWQEPERLLSLFFLLSGVTLLAQSWLPYPFVYSLAVLVLSALWLEFAQVSLLVLLFVLLSQVLMSLGLLLPPPATSDWQILMMYMPLMLVQIPPLLLAASLAQAHRRTQSELQAQQEKMQMYQDLLAQQQAYRETADQVQAILQYAGEAIITVDQHGQILSFNHAAETIYGCSEALACGHDMASFCDDAGFAELLERVPYTPQCMQKRANGQTFHAEISLSHYDSRSGPRWILIVRDLSEKLRHEKLKNEFISNVSHELRTPLTVVLGTLGLLRGGVIGPVPENQQALLQSAWQNANRLSELVNSLLDLQKIAHAGLALECKPHPLPALLQQAQQDAQAIAQQFQVVLQLGRIPDLRVMADAGRLQQILHHLLSNACKFSPAGSCVLLSAHPLGERVRIVVQDQGCGIAPEFAGQLFEKFTQSDGSSSRQRSGAGLAISRALAQEMGGTLDYHSTPGKGSDFYVELALATA